MTLTLDQLNASQRQAVEWGEGPMLVLAGPGSGKTHVLTMRVVNLVKNSPGENFRVLGLTFTVKAANEMKDRIEEYLGEHSRRIQIRTFHSFCSDLLRQHGSHLQLKPDFSIITDEKDRLRVLNDAIREASKIGYEIDNPEDYMKAIDNMFMNAITADTLLGHINENRQQEGKPLVAVFSAYLNQLIANNQLDFNALIHYTRELLTSKPRIARQVRMVYKYICVDEFQDTNIAQYKILRLLAENKTANLFVVADDDQIIFQWNGADPKRFEEMKEDYSPELVQLPENFRCPRPIVDLANRLISFNNQRIKGKANLTSQKESPNNECIKWCKYPDFEKEIQGLARQLESIPKNQRESCVVIARDNKLLTSAKEGLEKEGIKAEIVKKKQDFETPPMRFFYGLLKLANSPESRSQLNKLCSALNDFSGITISAAEVSSKAAIENMTLFLSFLNRLKEYPGLEDLTDLGLNTLYNRMDFKKFITDVFNTTPFSFLSSTQTESFPYFDEEKQIWEEHYNRAYRNFNDSLTLHILLQEIDLTPKSMPLSQDCVRLQTVHTAKGTEFLHVYIIGLVEDYFPAFQAMKQGANGKVMEEERRNCFVAVTRASETLYMSFAGEYFGWEKEPSRFLKEMGIET